ncbi:arylesterase [Desertibaculum subflavum]|uniref:arylesterase n=1 Tax=Desertibaculum subflavum TaxID=2268458 RepID=UPI0034D19E48
MTGLWLLTSILALSEAAAARETLVVALGDSLMAGYGLDPEQALPARLESKLKADGLTIRIQNASVSGDTTAGGLARLDWAMADKPDFALVALGANDMLRGLDPAQMRANLDKILTELKARGIKPILFGMRAQRNLGTDYVNEFEQVYADLARAHGVPFYPFLLEGIAMQPGFNLPDGLHPNARGIDVLADRIAPFLERAIRGG